MTEFGLVIKIEDQTASVRFKRNSACGNCKACGMLSTQNEIVVEVPNDIGAREGEYVEVSIVMKKAITASAIAYLFPLIMLGAGALFGWLLTSVWHIFENRDVLMAICALIFVVLSFLLLKIASPLYNKTVRRVYTMVGIKSDENKEKE